MIKLFMCTSRAPPSNLRQPTRLSLLEKLHLHPPEFPLDPCRPVTRNNQWPNGPLAVSILAAKMLNRIAIAIFGCFAATAPLSFSADKEKPKLSPEEQFSKEIVPILKKHCFDCHDADVAKADLNRAHFDTLEKIHEAKDTWETILERVYAFEMPPPGKKDLSFDNQRKLVDWLKDLPKPEKPDCDQIASDRNA